MVRRKWKRKYVGKDYCLDFIITKHLLTVKNAYLLNFQPCAKFVVPSCLVCHLLSLFVCFFQEVLCEDERR